MFEQKGHGVVGQILGLGGHRALHRQVAQEALHVLDPQTLRRRLTTEGQKPVAPIDVGLLGADGILHRPDGPGQGLQERKPLGSAGERGTLRQPRGRRRRARDGRMVMIERAPAGLPPVPVDRLAGRALGQIDEQQLQGIDQLSELPLSQLPLGGYLLEVPRNLVGCQLR